MIKKILILIFAFLLSPLLLGVWVWFQIPSSEEIRGCMTTRMFQVELCPKNKSYMPLRQISPFLVKTVVMTEDSSFWQHRGFDWDSIKKNYEENRKLGRYKRGGSTISQQLAKNLFLTSEKTLVRKAIEAFITIRIEQTLTKKEILERYLNVVEFGKNIYGVKAASRHYFQKSPSDLTIVESAFLAMLLPSPVKYSASFYKKELSPFASRRMDQIIRNLYSFKKISEDEYNYSLVALESFFRPQQINPEGLENEIDLTLENLEQESLEEDRF